jgi:hypothetical protein
MPERPNIPPREWAIYGLRKLSPLLRQDVMDSADLLKKWGVDVTRSMKLTGGISVDPRSLFAVFQAASDERPQPPLLDSAGKEIQGRVLIDEDGAGVLETEKRRLRFPHIRLMASDPAKRLATLDQLLASINLVQRDRETLREIVAQEAFDLDAFMKAAEIIASSPTEFANRLREQFSRDRVLLTDVLPEDPRHWDHLIATRIASTTLASFAGEELATEREARLQISDAVSAFRLMSLSFSSPALVPRELLTKLPVGDRLAALSGALELRDHFALIGALELASAWIADDPGFSALGEQLMDKLFGDMNTAEALCSDFASAFMLAIARLAEDERTRSHPAFWRRLAAASHAQLIVRASAKVRLDHRKLFEGAVAQTGHFYFLSIYTDFVTNPQWRAEWIDPKIVIADACGRALSCVANIPDTLRPASWQQRIDAITAWLQDQGLTRHTMFPSVVEGARRATQTSLSEFDFLRERFEKLIEKPTLPAVLQLGTAISSFGIPREALGSLSHVVGQIRRGETGATDDDIERFLRLACHVAVIYNDVPLSDSLADVCIERIRATNQPDPVTDGFYRLIECAAADTNREAANASLVRRLEIVAHVIDEPSALAQVLSLLRLLKMANPALTNKLGRAIAVARLGATKSRAA